MPATAVPITSETELDTAITDGNTAATQPTTGTFTANVTEAAPPTNITAPAAADLILDGFSAGTGTVAPSEFTLTGDGTAAALRINANGGTGTGGTATMAAVTIEDLNITNTGTANAIADFGTVLFSDAGTSATTPEGTSIIGAAIAGTGAVNIGMTGTTAPATAVIFNAANTYTGATAIRQDGTLTLGTNGSIADSTAVAIQGTLNASSAETASGAATTIAIESLTGANGGSGRIILGNNTLSVNEATNGTFAGVIENATGATTGAQGGLTLTNGVLTLTGANTYEGSTRVAPTATGGTATLALTGTASIAGSANVSIKAGGTLDITGETAGVTISQLNGQAGGAIALGANTLTVVENVTAATFGGIITSTGGGLTVGGTDELTLTGANTYTGATLVTAGAALAVGAGGSLGTGLVTDNGTLDFTGVTTGTETIVGLAGTTTTASVILGSNALVVEPPTGGETFAGVISGGGALQIGAPMSGTGATAVAANTGTETLSNAETYTGSTRIYGDLVLTGGSIADSANVALKAAGAELDLTNAATTAANINGSNDVSAANINQLTGQAGSTLALGGTNLIVTETTAGTFNGNITGDDFFTVRGPGTLTLGGATASFEGEVVVGGHLSIASANVLADAFLADNGEVDISTALATTAGASSTAVTVDGLSGISTATLTLGANTLNVAGGSVDIGYNFVEPNEPPQGFAGVISGSGGLTVSGGLELSGANTYTGVTTITGTLDLAGGTIANSSAIVDNGRLIFQGASGTFAQAISGTGSLEVSSVATFTETMNGFSESSTAGSLTLTAVETYMGATTVAGSTLTIGAGGSIAASSGVTLEEGQDTSISSTFDIGQAGGTQVIKALFAGDTGETVNLGATNLLITGTGTAAAFRGAGMTAPIAPTGGNIFDGVIMGTTGQLQIGVAETFAISAVQTYTGSTVISGALFLEGAGSIADSANVSLKATTGATTGDGYFDISGTTATTVAINTLTGQGGTEINLGTHTLSINESAAPGTYSGVIEGSGGLTVTGSQFLSLDGANTYTGATTVTGSLELGTMTGSMTAGSIDTATGTGSSMLIDDGFFAIAANATVDNLQGTSAGAVKTMGNTLTDFISMDATFAGVIHGTGGVLNLTSTAAATADTLTLSGASDFTGGIHLNGTASLMLEGVNSAGAGPITFESGATAGTTASTGTLMITNAALTGGGTATESFGNMIDGLATTSMATNAMTVDLTNLTFNTTAGTAQTFTVGTGGNLVITEGNVSVTFHTDLTAGDTVAAMADGHGGTAFHFASMVA